MDNQTDYLSSHTRFADLRRQRIRSTNFQLKNKFQMKHKFSINRLAFAFASVLLCAVFYSCETTHIEFTIQWAEVWKTIGLIVLGAVILIAILLYLFRNFRVW